MPDKKITVTNEMRKAARDVLRAFVSGPKQGMIGSSELARAAAVEIILTAALNTSVKDEFLPLPATLTDEYLREVRNLAAPTTDEKELVDPIRELGRVRSELARMKERAKQAEAERDEMRAMTARDHLAAAWGAAYVPGDGIIPAGAEYMEKYRSGSFFGPRTDGGKLVADGGSTERRLLDEPTPKRPEGAAELEAILAGSWPLDREGLSAAANDLALNGVRVTTEGDPR